MGNVECGDQCSYNVVQSDWNQCMSVVSWTHHGQLRMHLS